MVVAGVVVVAVCISDCSGCSSCGKVLLLFLADRIQSMGSSIFLFCVENLSCLLRV